MRNWNSTWKIPGLEKKRFTSYLWGIETRWHLAVRSCQGTFTSYLWGIETVFAYCNDFCKNLFTSYLWGIETFLSHLLQLLYLDSHPTYEELKPFFSSAYTSSKAIHILPMRNWNTSTGWAITRLHSGFTSYLWGIETQVQIIYLAE